MVVGDGRSGMTGCRRCIVDLEEQVAVPGCVSRVGQGKPVGHWGGRLIWQLGNHADLLVCWRATTEEPRRVEESMLAALEIHYGRLPFANLSH